MKKVLFLLFLIPIAGFSQIEVYVDTMKKDSPNESWIVNKRYDKDGNITPHILIHTHQVENI